MSELSVQTLGDPTDPTVLLVAGAAGSMESWDLALCERLVAGGRHVVRYDHRDTGRSPTDPPGAPTYGGARLQRDAEELVAELAGRHGPLHLVGVSMGGGIAQALALHRPDLVRTLTLIATTAVGGIEDDLPGADLGEDPPEPDWADAASYADWVLASERLLAGSIPLEEEHVRASARAVHARATDVAAAGNHWLVLGGDEEHLDVHDLTVVTLVVHGSLDPLFPLPHGEALAAAVPGAELLVVEGMGHQVPPPPTWDEVVPALLRHTAR